VGIPLLNPAPGECDVVHRFSKTHDYSSDRLILDLQATHAAFIIVTGVDVATFVPHRPSAMSNRRDLMVLTSVSLYIAI